MQSISPHRTIPSSRFAGLRGWCCGAAMTLVLANTAYAADPKPIEPPKLDIEKICKKIPGILSPERDWTKWDGKTAGIPASELYRLAILYTEGNNSVPADPATAAKLYEAILVDKSSPVTPEAQFGLGVLLLRGDGVTQDTARAIELLEAAMKSGNAGAAYALGHYYESTADFSKAGNYFLQGRALGSIGSVLELAHLYREQNIPSPTPTAYEDAIILAQDMMLKSLALGDCSAFYQLGMMYFTGKAVPVDTSLSARWFEVASRAGERKAILRLADMYNKGFGVERDNDKALMLWKKAADMGSETAMYDIGMAYLLGNGLPTDVDKAVQWFTLAAKRYHMGSLEALVQIYRGKYGQPFDAAQHVYWLEKAVELPNVDSDLLVELASAYGTGTGTARDTAKAFAMLEQATQRGNPDGIEGLAQAHLFGRGTPQRPTYSLRFFRLASSYGNASAMLQMAHNYEKGIGVVANTEKQQLWINRAIAAGSDSALLLQAEALATKGDTESLKERIIILKRLIRNDSRKAMILLAESYQDGRGVKQDDDKAEHWFARGIAEGEKREQGFKAMADIYILNPTPDIEKAVPWLEKAAQFGNADAAYTLGKYTLTGVGKALKPDPRNAIALFQQAAAKQHEKAMEYLGRIYLQDTLVPQDKAKGVAYLTQAAEYGSAKAAMALSYLYESGSVVPRSPQNAAKWHMRAALLGDVKAMMAVARDYAKGYGVEKDGATATYWFNKSANSGNARAMRELGYVYLTGQGVERDAKQAIAWFEKAANAGDIKAMVELAQSYAAGYGVPESKEKALEWWKKAAAAGSVQAKTYLENMQESGYTAP